ncbi:MAG: type II toxin-antitoxin system HicA family toxin [Spirochaetaceae bacterium]|nr:type II toxin-antitoxin system HicA family toxin [Spirochaetaceae bacterium]
MPELKRISGEETIKRLEKLGFHRIRQRGSHVILKKCTSEGDIGCVVPLHKELAIGTLRGILKQAKVSIEDFMQDL